MENAMKNSFFAAMMTILIALTGCGSGDVVVNVSPTLVKTTIPSSLALDGYVVENPTTRAFTSFQNTASVFAGVDPAIGAEYRAFIGFPLSGAGGVPLNAGIDSATLDIVIRNVLTSGVSVPILIELVSYSAPLQPNDFDRIILPPQTPLTIKLNIFKTDVGNSVLIDVTALMREAQRLRLPDFQVRILEDFGFVTPGLIEIDNTNAFSPQLTVDYFF